MNPTEIMVGIDRKADGSWSVFVREAVRDEHGDLRVVGSSFLNCSLDDIPSHVHEHLAGIVSAHTEAAT